MLGFGVPTATTHRTATAPIYNSVRLPHMNSIFTYAELRDCGLPNVLGGLSNGASTSQHPLNHQGPCLGSYQGMACCPLSETFTSHTMDCKSEARGLRAGGAFSPRTLSNIHHNACVCMILPSGARLLQTLRKRSIAASSALKIEV